MTLSNLLQIATPLVLLTQPATSELRVAKTYSKDYSWVTCEDFLESAAHISKAVGLNDPRDILAGGHAKYTCESIFKVAKDENVVDAMINVGEFVRGRNLKEPIDPNSTMEDVAGSRRNLHLSDSSCGFGFGQGNPGPGSDASAIGSCLPFEQQDMCPHEPCVKDYLWADLGSSNNDPFDTYEEFLPDYPSGTFYNIYAKPASQGVVWNGCERDRTDFLPVAGQLAALEIVRFIPPALDAICEAMDDDIEICIGVGCFVCVCAGTCIDLPNPIHMACAIAKGVAEAVVLVLETLMDKANFQDALVDSAEIEAAYEHTTNLLSKQCAIYDQAVRRCAVDLGIGSGCNGIDDDNDDDIDECDEDIVAPIIYTDDAMGLCSTGWFSSEDDALECVQTTIIIDEDCHGSPQPEFQVTNSCGDSTVAIYVVDECGNESTATIPVKIHDTSPQVFCQFEDEEGRASQDVDWIESGGAGLLKNPNFYYSAGDYCGEPLRVTVDIYSSEQENGHTFSLNQQLARFFRNGNVNDRAGVYLAMDICDPDGTTNCIKDPTAMEARLYRAKIIAEDVTGYTNSTECTLRVLPKGELTGKDIDVSDSTQKFLIRSHSSTFSV